MRGVLRVVMDSLGVRDYHFAQDGKDAVENIQLCSGTLKGAGGVIDCMMPDVLMPGVDGDMPLGWIRRSVHSSDWFVPSP